MNYKSYVKKSKKVFSLDNKIVITWKRGRGEDWERTHEIWDSGNVLFLELGGIYISVQFLKTTH